LVCVGEEKYPAAWERALVTDRYDALLSMANIWSVVLTGLPVIGVGG